MMTRLAATASYSGPLPGGGRARAEKWRQGHQVFAATLALTLCLAALLLPLRAGAANLIRDAEIEATLMEYTAPVLGTAGLSAGQISLHILHSPDINAFVTQGNHLFISSGLILAADRPGMLLGVIAHEVGHLAGGHVLERPEAIADTQMGAIATQLLGIAIAAVAKQQSIGTGVMQAGQHAAQRSLLAYTRGQEEAADQAALAYLDTLHWPAEDFLKMFEVLNRRGEPDLGPETPYMLTHPLTRERIAHVRNHIQQQPEGEEKDIPAAWEEKHARMLAKLRGFLLPPEKAPGFYPETDESLPARMARLIALYRQHKIEEALQQAAALANDHPDDPYLHDLAGQLQFESGRIPEAITSYRQAVTLAPSDPLLRQALGRALLAGDEGEGPVKAVTHLEIAANADRTLPGIWRQLGRAYELSGMPGLAKLALAEEAYDQEDYATSRKYLKEAEKNLEEGTPGGFRAADLRRLLDQKEDKEKPSAPTRPGAPSSGLDAERHSGYPFHPQGLRRLS